MQECVDAANALLAGEASCFTLTSGEVSCWGHRKRTADLMSVVDVGPLAADLASVSPSTAGCAGLSLPVGPASVCLGTASSSTERAHDAHGLRAMMARWFMMVQASKGKNLYVFSQEDEATQYLMLNDEQVLGCGHLNLGKYGYCDRCNQTLCWRCWQFSRDPVIRDLLSATVCEGEIKEWVNTCKVCSSTRPNDHCPHDCPGRIKYVTKIALETLFAEETYQANEKLVYCCTCATCVEKQQAHKKGENVMPSLCEARRGYEVNTKILQPIQLPDLHMCRKCFAQEFYNIEAMPLQLGCLNFRVLFRASRHCWYDTEHHTAAPPCHVIHTLEGGMAESMLEWACLHIGRKASCHWDGHPCEMVSTSILCFEALQRMDANRHFQAICIPAESWHSGTGLCDLSSRQAMAQYPCLDEHLYRHRIRKTDLQKWALCFREVVIDRRALRARLLKPHVFQWGPDSQFIQQAQRLCLDAAALMHCDSSGVLKAEHACRSIIGAKLVNLLEFFVAEG